MSKRLGFFKERYRNIIPSKPFPGYNVSITPSLSNNDETVTFTITSELPGNLNCNYVLLNTVDADWVGANASGSVQLDSTGNANVTATLDPDVNYDYVSNNVNLIFQLNTTQGGQLGTSSNVTFARGNTFVAEGGTTSQIAGSNLILHSYTTTGSQGFNITSLGGDPANTTVRHLIVGGGGRGGDGYAFRNGPSTSIGQTNAIAITDPIFDRPIVTYGGGGGAGGQTIEANITATNYSVANLSVVVGAGSNVMGTSGANSSFNSNIALGGGSGAGTTFTPTITNIETVYRTGYGSGVPTRTIIRFGEYPPAVQPFSDGTQIIIYGFPSPGNFATLNTLSPARTGIYYLKYQTAENGYELFTDSALTNPTMTIYADTFTYIGGKAITLSGSFTDATAHTGGPGGGGMRQVADQYDFRGANGTFTGGTAAQTVAFPSASGNVLLNYFGIMSGAGASENAQPSDPTRIYYAAGAPGSPYPSYPGFQYGSANGSIGSSSDITGSNVSYAGGGGGGPVPETETSVGNFIDIINNYGVGFDGGGNGGAIGGQGSAGTDGRGGGGGAGGTAKRSDGTDTYFGTNFFGGKGGDGAVYVTYPFFIRRMQV